MKLVKLCLLVLFLSSGVLAFEVSVQEIDGDAERDDPALYEIKVSNHGNEESTFSLSVQDYFRSSWYQYENRLEVSPGESETFNVEIEPGAEAVQERYSTDFTVQERGTGKTVSEEISYRVIRDRSINFESISLDRDTYKPGATAELEMTVRNVDTEQVDPEVTVEAFETSSEIEPGSITPGGLRVVTHDIDVPDSSPPGIETVKISSGDLEIDSGLEVSEVEDVDRREESTDLLLLASREITFENRGNVEAPVNETEVVPSYVEPFFTAPEAETRDAETGTEYAWSLTLEPGEEASITMRADYWIPVAGLAVLIGGFAALKRVTSGVSAEKKISQDDGVQVTIQVENSSSKTFDDVLLEDYVPNVVEVNTDFEMASPEVKHSKEGTKLRWWINDLKPGDQRIFRYSLKPKVQVEEGLTLDPAELKDGDELLASTEKKEIKFQE